MQKQVSQGLVTALDLKQVHKAPTAIKFEEKIDSVPLGMVRL